jgi:DNA-binding NtrC family response regulator
MASGQSKVLIVDDDPSHLEIYSMLMKQAGVEPLTALVQFVGVDLPKDESVGLVLLDYRLNSLKTSAELAQEIRLSYPLAPIVVLSDLWSLPTDIEPYVNAFVRKGEPRKLIETVARLKQGNKPDAKSMNDDSSYSI